MDNIQSWADTLKNRKDTPSDELVNCLEAWCIEKKFPHMRFNGEDGELSYLIIKQKNGLLVTAQGNIIAANDHTGFAFKPKWLDREPIKQIVYLKMEDPLLFEKLEGFIIGNEK